MNTITELKNESNAVTEYIIKLEEEKALFEKRYKETELEQIKTFEEKEIFEGLSEVVKNKGPRSRNYRALT